MKLKDYILIPKSILKTAIDKTDDVHLRRVIKIIYFNAKTASPLAEKCFDAGWDKLGLKQQVKREFLNKNDF